jgi:hypothetical protein
MEPRPPTLLQDPWHPQPTTPTVHAFSLTHPRLPTIWGIVGRLARAELGYQIHHFIIITHSSTHPPTPETEIHPFIAIPTFYLDPDRPRFALSPPLSGQRPVSGTDLWARPLHKRERKVNETIEREESGWMELCKNKVHTYRHFIYHVIWWLARKHIIRHIR